MKSLSLALLLNALLPLSVRGQQLSALETKTAESARARYYNLKAAGFQSLTCAVAFDFSTVPLLSQNNDDPTRKLLEATVFTVALDEKGRPSVQHRYPNDASDNERQRASQVTGLLSSFIGGLFQTWTSKGFEGPIPPFDSQIESVVSTDHGYTFNLRVPGAPVQILTDKAYLVTEIVSAGGKIVERPAYVPSPEGLILAGNRATDDSGQVGRTEISYELTHSVVDGLRVPSSARLRVNQNVDVKFALSSCVVKKAAVIHLNPHYQ